MTAAPSNQPLSGPELLRDELELERDRIVAQLAGAVAHKLKQPLAVAWGYLELLLDDPRTPLDPNTQRYLAEIRAAIRTMDDVVNRLQRATVYQTREYAGTSEILNLDDLPSVP
jgi:two-component system, cell cycle response regulator